jgi:hypothetical protein
MAGIQLARYTTKMTVILTQNQFHTEFRSLLIKGFHHSNLSETKMWDDDIPIYGVPNKNETNPDN